MLSTTKMATLGSAIYEITEYDPDHRFTWEQKLPSGALVADHRIASRDGATEIELSFTSNGLLANVVAALFSKMIAKYVATEARSLRTYCDTLSYQRASFAGDGDVGPIQWVG